MESASPEALGRRAYDFALRAVRLVRALPARETAADVLGRQLVRSAVSVATNYEEARGAVSHADFVAKIGLAYKERRESVLLLLLIRDAGLLPARRMEAIVTEAEELRAILGASLKTARSPKRR